MDKSVKFQQENCCFLSCLSLNPIRKSIHIRLQKLENREKTRQMKRLTVGTILSDMSEDCGKIKIEILWMESWKAHFEY